MPKDKTLKTNSIYYRFLKLLALAFVTAALFFLLLNQGGEKLLDYYFTKTNYMERENARRYNDLRDYRTPYACGQDLFRFKPAAPGRHPHSVIYGSGTGLASEKTSLYQDI